LEKGLKIIEIQSRQSIEFIDITAEVKRLVRESGCTGGLVLVFTPHTTAAVTINENADPAVLHDLREFLGRKFPDEGYFRHVEGNSPSHIMSSLISASETLIIENGELLLGTWQGVYFCEFDGPRRRTVYLKVVDG
jgi:secondary thiamine-phosphate synthase enzyme